MKHDPNVYGYVNGKAVYSADEFRYACRGFGALKTDKEIFDFAASRTSNWRSDHNGGSCANGDFRFFYLSDYCYAEPFRSLTKSEFDRLKAMQKKEVEAWKEAEKKRCWTKVETIYWADNSVEEVWRDKDGIEKTVMAVGPHGDLC